MANQQTFYTIPPPGETRSPIQTLEFVPQIVGVVNAMDQRYQAMGIRFLGLLPGLRQPSPENMLATTIPYHHLLRTTFGSDNKQCLKDCFGPELVRRLGVVINGAEAGEDQTANIDEILSILGDVEWLLNAVEKGVDQVEHHQYALYRLLFPPHVEPTPLAPGSRSARLQKRLQRYWLSSLDIVQERLGRGEDDEQIRVSYFGLGIPQLEDLEDVVGTEWRPLLADGFPEDHE